MDNPYESYETWELGEMDKKIDYELKAIKHAQREIDEKLFYLNYKRTMIRQEMGKRSNSMMPDDLAKEF